ncbi:MAG: hypothetical protein VKJ06_04570 [Vampirovibrionales bacterium]|nr:hypothetical protein [Vampirovibrionales bacterium]
MPFNASIEAVLPFLPKPEIGQSGASLAQIIVAFIFTVIFSVFSQVDRALIDLSDALHREREGKKIAQLQKKAVGQSKVLSLNRRNSYSRFLVIVEYPFDQAGAVSRYFDTFVNFQGKPLAGAAHNELILEFMRSEKAVMFCMEAARSMQVHYTTLRPSDPKPPFRVALHAIAGTQITPLELNLCKQIVRYAKPNQIVLSGDMKVAIEGVSGQLTARTDSMGIYNLAGSHQAEVFHLLTAKLA